MKRLLTAKQSAAADRRSIECGVSSRGMMCRAGQGVADVIMQHYPAGAVAVLCGPGNNGGDGFIVAQSLKQAGWPVQLYAICDLAELRDDAAWAASAWTGRILPLSVYDPAAQSALVVDALFGAGLSRPIEGEAARCIAAVTAAQGDVIAVDIPSGIDGRTGQIRGCAFKAAHTVSFSYGKTGHYLLPGRLHCGQLHLVDIGLLPEALEGVTPLICLNEPELWRAHWPVLAEDAHKYDRGQVLLRAGEMSGAARLAARACLRMGAGLLRVAVPEAALPLYAAMTPEAILCPIASTDDFTMLLAQKHRVALIGSGGGRNPALLQDCLSALEASPVLVLDADALTLMAADPQPFFDSPTPMILTPHEGEYARLFHDLAEKYPADKLARAASAAKRAGAVIVLKGADTVIAAPDGRLVINANAPSHLATAGSGDVLAGMIAGLVAQKMPLFEAACAAVWCHGAAAQSAPPALIAGDLPDRLPDVLRQMQEEDVVL